MARQGTVNLLINGDATGLTEALAAASQGIAQLNQQLAGLGAGQPLTKAVKSDTQGALAAHRAYGEQSVEATVAAQQQQVTAVANAALQQLEIQRQAAENAGTDVATIDAQILAEKRTWAAQMQAVTERGVEAETKAVERSFGSVPGAMTRSITGMITGTMTLRRALGNVAQSIIATLVAIPVKMATEWAAREIATLALHQEVEASKTAATAAGEATRLGIQTSSAAAGASAQAAAGSASVTGDAYKAAAATYASVADIPIVGPFLAPAAAAAAFAAVGAFDVFSAESGWDRVPYDGALTMLHANEMVLPAGIASPLRAALGGPGFALPASAGTAGASASTASGGDTHFHVSAPFTQNGGGTSSRALAREIASQHLDVIVAGLNRAHRNGRLVPGVTKR